MRRWLFSPGSNHRECCSKRRSHSYIVDGAVLELPSVKIRSRNVWRWSFCENWIPQNFPAIWYMYFASRSLYTHHLLKICGPTHKVNELDGCQNAWTRAATDVSMEKNKTTSISKACWYIKSKKEVTGNLFYLQLPRSCLQQWLHIKDDQCSYTADFFKP